MPTGPGELLTNSPDTYQQTKIKTESIQTVSNESRFNHAQPLQSSCAHEQFNPYPSLFYVLSSILSSLF
ncbi:MAG TPA: hypothetical protein VE978_04415 [Chitinophagales bacterium]|nr:hypothetical protein [Chitinophagales bacterium]